MAKTKAPKLVLLVEAADDRGIKADTMWHWVKRGHLTRHEGPAPRFFPSKTAVYVDERELDAFLADRK